MNTPADNFLWVEKWRPLTVEDCILPDNLKNTFADIVKTGTVPHMILAGTAGTGKTTVARAICAELELDVMIINASEENGIDVLRNKIRQFASSISMLANGRPKVVILDEADYLHATSTQVALRGFMEEFHSNCRFILTCNFKNRIIEPLHSRCAVIEFNTSKKDLAVLAGRFLKRLKKILDAEKIKYTEKVLAELIIRHAPDWRRVINECQRHSTSGEILPTVLVGMTGQNLSALVTTLREKDFKAMRSWVANNPDSDTTVLFRSIYDNLYDVADPASIPQIVVTLADYQFKAAFCADKELNLVACLTELMASANWK
jgi:DNA polymerase III delta prime subunit